MTLRLALADDHALFRAGMRALLEPNEAFCVVGEASNGPEALELARRESPDVMLMDLSMPELDGIEVTRRISETCAATRVLCLSMHADAEFVTGALRAGAAGYLLKESALEELETAIRAVHEGGVYLSPSVAGTVIASLHASDDRSPAESPLTLRETDVLRCIGEGRSTKEIAAELGISVKTVSTHRDHVMEKLDEHTIAGLVRQAIRRRLVSA